MTFGFAPRIEWDARIKGRGVVGVGEAEDLIHAAQLTWMPAEERRRYALTGPPPPDWFTGMQPAPWIDDKVISEGRKLAGVSLVDVPPVGVPPGQHIYVPAQTRRHVPPDVPPPSPPAWLRPGTEITRPDGKHAGPRGDAPVRSNPATPRHATPPPGDEPPAAPADQMIIGIVAAARYLGYGKPDSFRRARTRHPHPRRDQNRRRPALLDTAGAAQLAVQTQNRRQPHPRRRAGLTARELPGLARPPSIRWPARGSR
jgi:hypothetical protein